MRMRKARLSRFVLACFALALLVVLTVALGQLVASGPPHRDIVTNIGPIEPIQSTRPLERSIVFLGIQFVETRRLDRPSSEQRRFRRQRYHDVFRLTPVRWTPKGTELAEPFTLEALHYSNVFPLQPPLTVEEGEVYVANGRKIEHRRPFVEPNVLWTGQVDRRPSAMSVFNGIVYVGSAGQVTAIDMNQGGRAQILHTDPTMDASKGQAKPIDFFVRLGPRLVAIDNVVVPKFAYVFERDAAGRMRFLYRDDLPEGVNEQITHGTGSGDAMFLTSRFGHRGAFGYRLYRCRVGASSIANSTVARTAFPRGTFAHDRTERVGPDLGGPWTGIAATQDRILLGGQHKGIVILDPDAPEAARFVDVGGTCDGLLLVGKTVLALVNAGRGTNSKIVAYHWNGATRTLERIREDTLTVRLRRIAR